MSGPNGMLHSVLVGIGWGAVVFVVYLVGAFGMGGSCFNGDVGWWNGVLVLVPVVAVVAGRRYRASVVTSQKGGA